MNVPVLLPTSDERVDIMTIMIKAFKDQTNLSIRKIIAIADLNKDKINKMLRS